MRLNEQMKQLHNPDVDYDNVFYNNDWTMEDVKLFFEYVEAGYLIQGEDGFILNDDYEGKPMCEVLVTAKEKEILLNKCMIKIIKENKFIKEVGEDMKEGYTPNEAIDRNASYYANLSLPSHQDKEQEKKLIEMMWEFAHQYYNEKLN